MPQVLKDCVAQVKADGQTESYAYAVCIARLKKSGRIKWDAERKDWIEGDNKEGTS